MSHLDVSAKKKWIMNVYFIKSVLNDCTAKNIFKCYIQNENFVTTDRFIY